MIEDYQKIMEAKQRWPQLSEPAREEVMRLVASFRNSCLRLASERGFPMYEASEWYVVSQPAWEQFTARAKVEDLMNAMMELDDPKSARVRQSGVVLLEWPDPTEGMFDDND